MDRDYTLSQALETIIKAGYSGVCLWYNPGQGYMGCFMAPDDTTPLYGSNLWDYVQDPLEVYRRLAAKAERNPYQPPESLVSKWR